MSKKNKHPIPDLQRNPELAGSFKLARDMTIKGESVAKISFHTGFSQDEIAHWQATVWNDQYNSQIAQAAVHEVQLNRDRVINITNNLLEFVEGQAIQYNEQAKQGLLVKPAEMKAVVESVCKLFDVLGIQEVRKNEEALLRARELRKHNLASLQGTQQAIAHMDPDLEENGDTSTEA